MSKAILPHLPHDKIMAAFERSPGNEIKTGKFDSPESSAALAANMFGIFLDDPHFFPALPGSAAWGQPATKAYIEFEAPFPWSPRGRHPWLDAAVITRTHLIGIESKRYEPFRKAKKAVFSDAYWRDVWGDQMGPFLAMRDSLHESPELFMHLDAAQLVKHAFGLRTEAKRRGLRAALVYLYAEPKRWPGGKEIESEDRIRHRAEIETFASSIAGAEVNFSHLCYRKFVEILGQADSFGIQQHVKAIQVRFPDI